MTSSNIEFVLASSSKYKIEVFKKLNIPFSTLSPDVDESPLINEKADELVLRLAQTKAETALAMARQTQSVGKYSQASATYYIGVDQVATFDGQIIGKSHCLENAIVQLSCFAEQSVTFQTGISLVSSNNVIHSCLEPFEVKFKKLTQKQIKNYLVSEQPFDCAGSFKCEGQGILLFENLNGRDINSLVGMPLIAFQELCLKFDIDLFDLIN